MKTQGASALVTGAGRGIGRAIALALGRAGAGVTLVARTKGDLDSVAAEIRQAGAAPRAPGRRERRRRVPRVRGRGVQAHGRLQILVNNAGLGVHAPLAETSDQDWERTIGTNLSAVFRITRAALPISRRAAGTCS